METRKEQARWLSWATLAPIPNIRRNASFHLDPQNRFNFTQPNFIDHDDIHLIWQEPQWLDYQISFQQYTTRGFEPRPQQCNDIEHHGIDTRVAWRRASASKSPLGSPLARYGPRVSGVSSPSIGRLPPKVGSAASCR